MGVAVDGGGRGVLEGIEVEVENGEGEMLTVRVGSGFEAPQEALSRDKMTEKTTRIFIRWILAQIKASHCRLAWINQSVFPPDPSGCNEMH
jgi:hypothetical protein